MSDTEQISPPASRPEHMAAWVPLRRPLFRGLWAGSFVSNIGSWMHEVGAAWLMTSLAPQPFMVALVPAAATLPVFLLALPAGALADVIDRRRLLIFTQTYLFFCAGILAGLTYAKLIGPWQLIAFTFMLAVGNALTWPAWQAITPELVPNEEVPAAISLGGISFNLARIVGPVLGGTIVGKAGPAAVFLANAVSFLAVVFVLLIWRRKPVHKHLREPVLGAMRAGVRYVRHAPAIRAILLRAGGVILFGGAYWALFPLHARQNLNLDPFGYGKLLGWFGAGSVAGSLLLPRFRRSLSTDSVITLSAMGFGLLLIALAYARQSYAVDFAMIVGGFFWPLIMLSINISVLHLSPEWVRSRAAAIYLLVFTGTQCAASVFWGAVAQHIGIPNSLVVAGALLFVAAPLLALIRLPADDEHLDLSPSNDCPPMAGDNDPEHDEGPVLVVIEYRISPESAEEFTLAMKEVRSVRMRNGSMRWDLFQDITSADRYFESFIVESWIDYLRQHQRLTVTDRTVEERAIAFHDGQNPPRVQHFIGITMSRTVVGALLLVTAPLMALIRIPADDGPAELTLSHDSPSETGEDDPEPDEGPVLVVIQYRIDPETTEGFTLAMKEMRSVRMRNGVLRWDLFQDTTCADRYFESFIVKSWIDYLRQHQRLTVPDRALEERAVAFHNGQKPPRIQHFIARS